MLKEADNFPISVNSGSVSTPRFPPGVTSLKPTSTSWRQRHTSLGVPRNTFPAWNSTFYQQTSTWPAICWKLGVIGLGTGEYKNLDQWNFISDQGCNHSTPDMIFSLPEVPPTEVSVPKMHHWVWGCDYVSLENEIKGGFIPYLSRESYAPHYP